MSRPFAVALLGLAFSAIVLAVGDRYRLKAAVPIAFLVGGTLILGGLAIGMARELSRRGGRRKPRRPSSGPFE